MVRAQTEPKANVELSARIIRADGTVEELGIIAAHHDSRWKQWRWDHIGKPLADARIRRANRRAQAASDLEVD